MTTTRLHASLVLLVTLAACRGGATNQKETSAPAATAAPETHAPADASILRIEAGMLRDLRITTAAVETRKGGEEVSLLGELAVDQRAYAEVGVPMQARVSRLLADSGDLVKKDQPLLMLTSPDLGRARAEYLSASAHVQLANAALLRKRGLADDRVVPLREVQEAESELETARATVRSAEAALSAFGVTPSQAEAGAPSAFSLRSPIGGTVIARDVLLGQMAEPSARLFSIGDLSVLWLTVHAFERDAIRIAAGSRARLSFPALPGRPFEGRVALVGRQVDKDSRTIPVRIDVRNPGATLRPGMSATAMVQVGAADKPILTVPIAAVQRVKGEWCVFLPQDTTTFLIRKIGRGRDFGGEVEVLSGVIAGETVVVDGAFLLKAQAEKGEAEHGDHK